MKIKETIVKAIKEITGINDIKLDVPEKLEFGDYSASIALQLAKSEGKIPREKAEELVDKLYKVPKLLDIVEKIEIAGPGFINFFLKKEVLIQNLRNVHSEAEKYGCTDNLKGKKVVVEYTDPNPFKEFHIGHFISNVTGESISRLQEVQGAEVWRADYFGDVGVHVAKSIWGIKKKMQAENINLDGLGKMDLIQRINFMGQGYALGSRAFDEDENAKEEIGRLNTVLYICAQRMWKKEGKALFINYDPEGKIADSEINDVYDLYVLGRKWSLDYFETIYKILGTKFDGYYPESLVGESGYHLVKDNIGKVFDESEGAIIFKGEKFGLHTRVFINKHNLPTYEAKELGLAPMKYSDFVYDKSIIVVGKEIKEYFAVLIKALTQVNKKLGDVTYPICTGMVSVPSGKMGSRFGNVVTVLDLLDQLKSEVRKILGAKYSDQELGDISEKVALGALKYAFLKNSVGSDFVFDMQSALSLDGNSGPYIQYTFARIQSVLAKAKETPTEFGTGDYNNAEAELLRTLVHFPEIVAEAGERYAPNIICNYLYDLAQKYNSFYAKYRIIADNLANNEYTSDNSNKIIGGENEDLRLAITSASGTVLKNGLELLGIQAPKKM